MGALDLLKSERGVMTLLFLGVLAGLLLLGYPPEAVNTWGVFAGGVVATYVAAKSAAPGLTPSTNGLADMLRSERALVNLVFLGVLAALLFTRAAPFAIESWRMYAGGLTAVFTVAKTLRPGDGASVTKSETAAPGSEVAR